MELVDCLTEVWKEIPDYPNYSVSNLGRVKTTRQNPHLILKMQWPPWGGTRYAKINLWNDSQQKAFFLHRLLAAAFIPNPDNLPEVDHIDRNTTNNQLDNLRWVSKSANKINRILPPSKTNLKHIRHKEIKPSPWGVTITRDRQTIYCKWFVTLEEAISARDEFLIMISY